jgi:C1A family cysteine protease
MDTAFTYVQTNGGLPTESTYPYTSGNGVTGSCVAGKTLVAGVAPKGFTDVQANSVSALASAVAQQPVSIAIEADQSSFQFYSSGVLTSGCGQNLDHGVLVVGYGTLNGVDYWRVKNSWGPTWGDQGYINIQKSAANLCGVLSAASYPNL